MNKTDEIFLLSAPYDNPNQGTDKRLLFVCSAGLLRSATGANLYAKKGHNTRNCGTHEYALIPLSVNLIAWADNIIFVNGDNYKKALNVFEGDDMVHMLIEKSYVLNIPDIFAYNDPMLIRFLEEQIEGLNVL